VRSAHAPRPCGIKRHAPRLCKPWVVGSSPVSGFVRPARDEDHAAVAALCVAAFRAEGHVSERYLPIAADVAGRAAHATVLVAERDGVLAGTVTLILDGGPLAEMAGAGEAELRVLAVAPRWQRQGVGEALVRACIDAAAARGRVRLVCSCLASMTAARALYARMGFRRVPDRDYAVFSGFDRQALVLDLRPGGR
jgi:ribosomal protein S18 acetylase RimI-like enzyme